MIEVRLPPEVHQSIYLSGIALPALSRTMPVAKPVAKFIGGQPGCGKSTVARNSRTWFERGNFVHVDVDRLRELHPQYLALVGDPATERNAPSAVQKDCSMWADMLRDDAAGQGRNLLLESSMRVPSQFRDCVNSLRLHGYAVDVRVVAVHAKASEVSLLQRFEHEKQVLGYGREIPSEYHDLAASGIVDTVRMIEAEKLVDHLVISDRAGNTIYENRLVKGEWQSPAIGATEMETFRERSYGMAEKAKIAALWTDVVDMMAQRGAPADELLGVTAKAVAAQAIAQEALGPDPVTSTTLEGHYNGRILEHRPGTHVVVQKIGRDPDRVAMHDIRLLSRVPDVGEVVHINYRAGVGQVSAREHGIGLCR